jgi:hypothetical protein
MDLLPITVVFGTSLWVLVDARNIGIKKGSTTGFFNMGPTGWFVACLLCWIAAFPMYLVKRREHLLTLEAAEQAGSTESTDFVSQLGALTDLSAQGLLTAEEFRTKRLALVARILEQTPHADFMSRLGTLADLSTQGFLTDEEFQVRKKELVHRMVDQSSDDGVLASH